MPGSGNNDFVTLGYGINTITGELAKQAIAVELDGAKSASEPKKPEDQINVSVTVPMPKPATATANATSATASTVTIPKTTDQPVLETITKNTKETQTEGEGVKKTDDKSSEKKEVKKEDPPVALKIQTIPADDLQSEFKVYTSLSELKKSYSGNLSASVSKGKVGVTSELDFSNIKQQSVNDVYCVLHLHASTEITTINGKYKLDPDIEELLEKDKYNEIVKTYGTGFVDSIRKGRFAVIIIQVHLFSTQEQRTFTANVQGAVGESIKSGGKLTSEYDRLFKNKKCTIYQHVGGIDYVATPIPNDEASISNIIAKFSTLQQTAKPVQIGWTFKPYYMAVSSTNRQKALEFEELIGTSHKLGEMIARMRMAIKADLQALYATDEWPKENWYLRKPSERENLILRLRSIDAVLENLTEQLVKDCCDGEVLKKRADQIKTLNIEIKKIGTSFPAIDELPVIVIPSDQIRSIKHKEGQYEFDINPPDGVTTLRFYIKKLKVQQQQAMQAVILSIRKIIKAAGKIIDAANKYSSNAYSGIQQAILTYNIEIVIARAEQAKRAYQILMELYKQWANEKSADNAEKGKIKKIKILVEKSAEITRSVQVIGKVINLGMTDIPSTDDFPQLLVQPSAQPTPAQPTPAQPTPAQPTPAQPTLAQPTLAQPTPAQPTLAQPKPWYTESDIGYLISSALALRPEAIFLSGALHAGWQKSEELATQLIQLTHQNKKAMEGVITKAIVPVNLGSSNGQDVKWALLYVEFGEKSMTPSSIICVNALSSDIPQELGTYLNDLKQKVKIPDEVQPKLLRIVLQDPQDCGPAIVAATGFLVKEPEPIEVDAKTPKASKKSKNADKRDETDPWVKALEVQLSTLDMEEVRSISQQALSAVSANNNNTIPQASPVKRNIKSFIDDTNKLITQLNVAVNGPLDQFVGGAKPPAVRLKRHNYESPNCVGQIKGEEIKTNIKNKSELPVGKTLSQVYLKPVKGESSSSIYKVGIFARCDLVLPKVDLPADTEVDQAVAVLSTQGSAKP